MHNKVVYPSWVFFFFFLFLNAGYANTPWQEAKAADTARPDPTLRTSTIIFFFFFFYLRIILTPLKQDRAFGPFQHLGLRGRSILAP